MFKNMTINWNFFADEIKERAMSVAEQKGKSPEKILEVSGGKAKLKKKREKMSKESHAG